MNQFLLLIALCSLSWFVYLYTNQSTELPKENIEAVEVIDFSKPNERSQKESRNQEYGSIYAGEPIKTTYPNKIKVLQNKGFVVGYDEKRKNPAWVAYKLSACEGKCFSGLKRPSRFQTDYRTRAKVEPSDYRRSGYDRGHMAPNYAISTHYGKEAQRQTFLMTNIVPQRRSLNGGIWREIESQIADEYSEKLEEVWVVTGPIYDDSIPDRFLRNGTEIPDGFYKIVLDEQNEKPRAMGYVIPQSVSKNANPSSFVVSVDDVEDKTGLDFFALLEDLVETEMEAKRVYL